MYANIKIHVHSYVHNYAFVCTYIIMYILYDIQTVETVSMYLVNISNEISFKFKTFSGKYPRENA